MKTIILATLENSFQANLLKETLGNEGIESFFKNENISSVLGNIPGFQIEIYVFKEDYQNALIILQKGFPELAI